MAAADLSAWLVEATLAGSAALLVVLALRGPLRRVFGAGAAYAAWSALPVVLVGTLLPAMPMPVPSLPMSVMQAPIAMLAETTPSRATPDIAVLACLLWLAGCAVFAACFAWQQRRFVRGLGRIATRGDGIWLAKATAGLPAVIGVLRPRIVMPADALFRYDATERRLMLAHEREHIRHGDLLANAAVVVLRCVFWFNPLLHVAVRRFRDDQELACDARVIARNPQQRRAYGEAMFKTQLATQRLPLGCHWGQSHPLKERIEMLKQPTPSSLRRNSGRALVIAILLASGYAAWAAQPAANAGESAAGSDTLPQASIDNASRMSNPPIYPVDVQKRGVTGMVVMIVDVAVDGSVSAAKIDRSAGDQRLDASALEAVKKWKFRPAMKNGKPVVSQARVPVDFRIEEQPDAPITARQAMASTTGNFNTYERMQASLSASWMPPKPPQDDC